MTWLLSGLGEMAPGPELAAALAVIDRSRLSGYDAVVVMRARARQIAHEQAELYADMVAVAERVKAEIESSCRVGDGDVPRLAAAEIGAALALTKRAAKARLEDAWLVVERLPQVWEALAVGAIDVPKAKVFAMETRVLEEPLARGVAARMLPGAPELTTGQLAHRLRKLVMEADPAAARRDYERGVQERKVVHGTNPDGTGYLSGVGLPVEQAAAASERIDAIARAAKQAGDTRLMDQIRSDVYLGLLTGTWDGPGPVHRRGVVELTADLPTLLGLADHVADLDGWGPVIADVARQVAARMSGTDTVWRYSITEPTTGRLLHHGTTRRRPPPRPDPRRHPTARDRAYVIARDRTCRGPGCRAPARRAEIDHLIEHARGGPTRLWNLDAKCASCHDLKDGGWRVERDALGQTIWTSPLGHIYTVPPVAITEPVPLPAVERHFFEALRQRR